MTLDEFLRSPVRHISRLGSENVPPEWTRAAWEERDFRDQAIESLCRSVSKIGTLNIAGDWLEVLPQGLTIEQAVALYESIRDGTERSETEWRAQFEAAFPLAAPRLPPVDRDRELRNGTLILVLGIYFDRRPFIDQGVSILLDGGFTLEEAVLSSGELAEVPEGEACLAAIQAIHGPPIPEKIAALELPLLLGKPDVLEYIKQLASHGP